MAGFTVDERDRTRHVVPVSAHCGHAGARRSRAALFEDTGLGKSRAMLEWIGP